MVVVEGDVTLLRKTDLKRSKKSFQFSLSVHIGLLYDTGYHYKKRKHLQPRKNLQ